MKKNPGNVLFFRNSIKFKSFEKKFKKKVGSKKVFFLLQRSQKTSLKVVDFDRKGLSKTKKSLIVSAFGRFKMVLWFSFYCLYVGWSFTDKYYFFNESDNVKHLYATNLVQVEFVLCCLILCSAFAFTYLTQWNEVVKEAMLL